MGTQRRYKVPIFDTTYRVVKKADPKDENVFGSESFAKAEAEYQRLIVSEPSEVFYLLHRARVVKRSDN